MKYCNDKILSQIDDYINTHKDEIIEDLIDIVRVPSVVSEPEPGAPFGKNCADMINTAAKLFERNGFKTDIKHDDGYALSYYGDGNKTIGVFAHTDVVPVDGQWQVCKPFEPVIKNGYIFGRGCNDDKSGVIGMLYAAKMIQELGLDFGSKLVMYNGSNEESGMSDVISFAKKEEMPDFSLVPDGMFPCVCGERSILDFNIISRQSLSKFKKFHGGEAFNIVLGFVEAELEYSDELWNQISKAAEGNDRIILTKDDDTIYISAKGIPKHIMESETSLNAAKLMAEVLCQCKAMDDDIAVMKDVASYLADCYGTGFGINNDDAVFGKLVCSNGIVRLTDDNKLKLTLDCRTGLSYALDDIKSQIIKACGDRWEYEAISSTVGYNMSDDAPAKLMMEDVFESISGIKDTKGFRIAAGTYARHLENALPIGSVAHYKNPPIDMPIGHGGVHQPDEMMSIDGFLEAIKILTGAILELDKLLNV